MLNELRARFAGYLASAGEGLLCAGAGTDLAALPVRYRADGVALDLVLPRWAEAAFQLARGEEAVLAIPLGDSAGGGSWLLCRGPLAPVPAPDWRALALEQRPFVEPGELYAVASMAPRRIDLLDVARSWGIAETFEAPSTQELRARET